MEDKTKVAEITISFYVDNNDIRNVFVERKANALTDEMCKDLLECEELNEGTDKAMAVVVHGVFKKNNMDTEGTLEELPSNVTRLH